MHKVGLMTVAAVGLLLCGSAAADIRNSKHDLGSPTGGAQGGGTAATTEVCVFCHTPHGSNTNVQAPLWNKSLPTTTYNRYSSLGTATLDGQEVSLVGSVSLACLSCHDGTQAMDVVLNKPGSGGYAAGGAELDALAIGVMTNGGTDPIPSLGSDLQDDHPVSIAYAGGACTGDTNPTCNPATATTGDKDFKPAQHATINTRDQWWVDTGTSGSGVREKTDMILYTRDFNGTPGPAVECASCHDPHEATPRPVSFLRLSNDNSDVCLACHTK